MKYVDLKVNYDKPRIWRRPTKEKLPKTIKPYIEYAKEILEFDVLKKQAKDEIVNNISKVIDKSANKNDLNMGLDEVMTFYSKAMIPTDDIDPQFLLSKTNQNTLQKKLQGWCKNLVYNIKEISKTKPYHDLIGKFKDIPAFVVLAGPSLKNNREKLLQAKGKSIIIAVDTSMRPLLDIGVVPDIVVTHDANPNGCKFFLSKDHPYNVNNVQLNDMNDGELGISYAELLADKDRLNFTCDTLGLFVNYCHPLTLLAFNGREKRFYTVQDPSLPVYQVMGGATNWITTDDKSFTPSYKGEVVGGSSVGHVAAYIAVALGCNPISFIGLDLSYPGGQTYVEGASNQKDMKKQKLIEMEDLSGNKVPTNISMLSYKMVLENSLPAIISNFGIQFYNCTQSESGNPSGILEVGAEPKPLQWVIDNYCKDININFKEKVGELNGRESSK